MNSKVNKVRYLEEKIERLRKATKKVRSSRNSCLDIMEK